MLTSPLLETKTGFVSDILIPVWNQRARTTRCLKSLFDCPEADRDFRLILIDNASDAETRNFLIAFQAQHPNQVMLLRNETNLGFVQAINQGLAVSTSPYVCLLNNDTIVYPGWLSRMIRTAELCPEIGVVNPGPYGLGYNKPWFQSWKKFSQRTAQREKGKWREMALASGYCMLIKRGVLEKIGSLNAGYGMGYYEDSDFSRRAIEAGFLCVQARDAMVYHEESRSFRMIKKKKEIAGANQKKFEENFGRPSRYAYCLQPSLLKADKKQALAQEWLQLARANHKVFVYLPRGQSFPGLHEHREIRVVFLPRWGFSFWCALAIRMKKKKFDRVHIIA